MTLDPVHHRILEHHVQRAADQLMPLFVLQHDTRDRVRRNAFDPNPARMRARLGRALVRFGRWVEGHCPDVLPEPVVPQP